MSKNVLRFIGGVAIVSTALVGCNRYVSDTSTYEIQILGDSYFDHDGYAPLRIALRTSEETSEGQQVVYHDRSITDAQIDPDINLQMDQAIDTANLDDYQIKTILIDGGANYVKERCPFNQTEEQRISTCHPAIELAGTQAYEMLTKAVDAGVENIVWAGYYYINPETRVLPQDMDTLNAALEAACDDINDYQVCDDTGACEPFNGCTFVDMSGVWTAEEAVVGAGHLINDGLHVTRKGGCLVGDTIWAALVENDIHRIPASEQGVYNADIAASFETCDSITD